MEIDRIIDLKDLLGKKSFFLFGPRATGKSTLVARQQTRGGKETKGQYHR
jgi:predicted AAA+ superfamily ATPase